MDNKDDIGFVHSLYGHLQDKPKFKIDLLFAFIAFITLTFIVWANLAEIDELARGEGKVIPSSKIQRVQNLDGGIVSEILVKSGEHVKRSDPLMKIDTTRFRASFEENQEEFLALSAKKIRLEMELKIDPREKIPRLNISQKLEGDFQGSQYIKNEEAIFKNRVNEYKSSLKILELQFGQKLQELEEIKSKIKQLSRNLKLVKEQRDTIEKMVKSNSKSRVELLNIEKEYSQLKGELESAKLSVPRSKLAINESETKIAERIQQFKSESSSELQKVISEMKKIEARLVSDTDKLEKTVIRSPVNGIIKQININTIGGVVKSGMDLIEIVPDSDILLVEAKIDPKDIAFINPKQKAIVKITAYDYTIFGGLEGNIVEISADSIKDKDSKDGKSYYKVIIKTDKNYLEKDGEKLPIIPGMIATVDILTGKKTIMDYILKPILKTKEGSLHER